MKRVDKVISDLRMAMLSATGEEKPPKPKPRLNEVCTALEGASEQPRTLRGQEEFEALVLELRRLGWGDDYIARQIVDDHARATGQSLHMQQHIVEAAVQNVKGTAK